MLVFGVIVLALLFASGIPIFIAFGIGGLIIILFYAGLPTYTLGVMFFDSINSFALLALPLFILAGNLMVHSGMGKALVDFLGSFVARIPGGVAVCTIIAMAFVGALTGTAMACLAMVGLIMFPAMLATNYDRGYSGGVLCSSCNLGNLIPPSVTFILFGFLTGTSVAKLFMAGIIPGLLMTVALSTVAIVVAKRRQFPLVPGVSWKERKRLFIKAIPGLMMPVIILGGIYGGIFSPTEAAAVACVYALLISVCAYQLGWKAIWASLTDTVRILGYLLIILGAVFLLGKAFMLTGFTQGVGRWVVAANLSPMGFLLLLGAAFVVLGFIMDMMPMLMILPIILPSAIALGIDPLHLGVMFVICVEIGIITPPAAQLLYITGGMFDIPIDQLIRGVLPFLVAMAICLIIVIFLPEISLWLPGTMLGGG